jgi:5,10-methenyltetrahydrofolate synthetase
MKNEIDFLFFKNNKSIVRDFFRKKRNSIPLTEVDAKSVEITKKVINLFSKFKKIGYENFRIMLYYAFDNEVETINIFKYCFENFGGAIYPKVENFNIETYWIKNLDEFKVGKYKIFEPDVDVCEKIFFESEKYIKEKNNKIDIVFVPGIVFDNFGNRIGFGKGFYDRFLQNLKKDFLEKNINKEKFDFLVVGLCYDFQVCKNGELEILKNKNDFPMDIIITDSNIYLGQDYRRRKNADIFI